MASASSTSAKNLFADSKHRLAERVTVNVNNMGSITRQLARGSKSNEMLTHAQKSLVASEATMDNSMQTLQKTQVLLAQLGHQEEQMKKGLEKTAVVNEQIKDMER